MADKDFPAGERITLYGVYRCSCGAQEFFGVSGRRFPRQHCQSGTWRMVQRAREEKFF